MALPVLGPLFAQLARTAIPTLGRGAMGQAVAGAGAGARAGVQAAAVRSAGAASQGGGLGALFQRLRGMNMAKVAAAAPSAQRTAGVQQAAAQGAGQAANAARAIPSGHAAGNAANAAQSAGKMAQSVAQGQQQVGNNLANGLRNASDAIKSSLKEGFRDIAKQLDLSALLQQRGGPNQQRQAEIANLRQQIAGHGSMMGQSLAPQDLTSRLADLEAMEAKDQAAREAANEEIRTAAKKLSAVMLGSVGAMAALPGIGKRFAEAMTQANEGLRLFNPQIANAYAQLDRTNLQLKYQRAGATAGTSASLANSMADLKRSTAPMANDLANLKNIVGITVVKQLTAIVQILELAVNVMPELKAMRAGIALIAKLLGQGQTNTDFLRFLDRVQSGEFIPKPPDPLAARRQLDADKKAARNRRAAQRGANPP
jgi:hypothetical protein